MKEYICKEFQTENGGYITIETELIRCKDCENWKPTGEGIGKCVMLSNRTCLHCEAIADFFCAMAEPKEKKSETKS